MESRALTVRSPTTLSRSKQKGAKHGTIVKRENRVLKNFGIESALALPNMNVFNDFENMFEDREDWMIRQRRAKLTKWKNPWDRRWHNEDAPATSVDLNTLSGIQVNVDCLSAVRRLKRWRQHKNHESAMPIKQLWKGYYNDRIKRHTGYFDVDIFSLYDTSMVATEVHPFDRENWEDRDVRQNFLHDQSISFNRNWFGVLLKKRGNDRKKFPIAEPKSMEMPMDSLPKDGDWEEEWYATWQRRRDPTFRKMIEQQTAQAARMARYDDDYSESEYSESAYSSAHSQSAYSQSAYSQSAYSKSAYSQSVYTSTYTLATSVRTDDDTWDGERPECGILQNTKMKIGDRVSRVTPIHTSSLRRSRWRKKYFPRGSFPYK